MPKLAGAWPRLKALVLRRRLDRDLDEELSFHLAMREADYVRKGIAPANAREAARRQFGNLTYFREQTREAWMFSWLEELRRDVRFALRSLAKSPGFSAAAVLAMAIGIGGNTAIFSLLDAARGRALPYKDPDRLVELWGTVMRAKVERRGNSYPDFLDWRAQARSFEDIAAFDSPTQTMTGVGEPERILMEFVSPAYFSLLGVSPSRGRIFTPQEDDMSKPVATTVLSDGLWKRRFGADPDVIGRTVTLNGRVHTIVGVMPPGFKGLSDTAELWIPFVFYAPADALAERGNRGWPALARLKPGVTPAAAQLELDVISRRLEAAYPDTNEKRAVEVSPLEVELFGALRPALLTLMAAVAFVLLIACANVANLLIARSEARRREIAVRTALGAGLGRLFRQLITESCVLTLLGASIGVMLARASVGFLIARSPVSFPSFATPALDLRAAAFTVGVSLACGILVGLAPGLQARRLDLSDALKETARGSDGRRSQRLRSALVVAELAMAAVLLVGAGLMIRSVRNLAALDPGFDPGSMLTLRISIPRAQTESAGPNAPATTVVPSGPLLERLRAIHGVTAVGLGSDLPLDGNSSAGLYTAEGMPPTTAQNVPRAYYHRVSPGFFSALRVPMIAGRSFTEEEISRTPSPVVVSEKLVKRFWPGQDPIGKRIKLGPLASAAPWRPIVGVVGEIKYRGLPENPTADPDVYLPFVDQNSQVGLAVRTSVTPSSLVPAIRAVIRASDPSIPIYDVATMEELMANQTSQSRFTMWLMGVFAGVALLLSVIGIYGVMSYLVTQRTREIGIRMALGAASGDILRLVVGDGARLIVVGVGLGVLMSLALQRLVASVLFGVTAADGASAIAIAVLAVVALVGCYLPAARAARVDPLNALRAE